MRREKRSRGNITIDISMKKRYAFPRVRTGKGKKEKMKGNGSEGNAHVIVDDGAHKTPRIINEKNRKRRENWLSEKPARLQSTEIGLKARNCQSELGDEAKASKKKPEKRYLTHCQLKAKQPCVGWRNRGRFVSRAINKAQSTELTGPSSKQSSSVNNNFAKDIIRPKALRCHR